MYGFNKKKTPEPSQKTCDKFTYTENIGETEERELVEATKDKKEAQSNKPKISAELKANLKLV